MFRSSLLAIALTASSSVAQATPIDLATMDLNGSAFLDGSDIVLTTSDSNQAGSAFISSPTKIDGPTIFSAAFEFSITNPKNDFLANPYTGGDGLTFVAHNDAAGAAALGTVGGGLGYGGIDSSIAVEFDTWDGGTTVDPNDNHVGINTYGSMDSLATADPGVTLETTSSAFAWVDYDGSTLDVSFNTIDEKPGSSLLSSAFDLTNLGNSAFFGFTAATGSATAEHRIKSFEFEIEASPTSDQDSGSTKDKIYVLLDFDGEVGAGFNVRTNLDGKPALESVTGGTHPGADLARYDLPALTERVQKIFDDSRMDGIVVVPDRAAIPGGATVYEVDFADTVTYEKDGFTFTLMQDGLAYDTGPTSITGVDLYDLRKGGTVVVFPDKGTKATPAHLAEVIAHEVGHGFGLLHSGRTSLFGENEIGVMTTPQDDTIDVGTFLGVPATVAYGPLTQNAQFATRYFVLNESYADLVDEYGTTRIGTLDNIGIAGTEPSKITLAGLNFFKSAFRAGVGEGIDLFLLSSEGASSGAYLRSLNSLLTEEGTLSFDYWDIFEYSIVGSSKPGGMIDLAFGIIADDGIDTDLFNSDLDSGKLTLFDFSEDTPLARFEIDVTVERGVSTPAPVPLPASALLLLIGLFGLSCIRTGRRPNC